MCGRFTLRTNPIEFCNQWGLPPIPNWKPRYNVSPGQMFWVYFVDPGSKQIDVQEMFWGLPSLSHPESDAHRLINARVETAADKPTFRNAIRERRCLILSDGFYEWKHLSGRQKQPVLVTSDLFPVYAYAGIWEWDPDPVVLDRRAFGILTREANSVLSEIHLRMPLLVQPERIRDWLDAGLKDPAAAIEMTYALTAEEVLVTPVGTLVNNARYDGEDCVTPQRAQKTLF